MKLKAQPRNQPLSALQKDSKPTLIASSDKKINRSSEETDTSLDSKHKKSEQNGKKKNYFENSLDKVHEVIKLEKEIQDKWDSNLNKIEEEESVMASLKKNLNELLSLYIEEEIIKHYCSKSDWQFESKLIQSKVFPTLDLLSIRRNNLKCRFEPFLEKITEKYLLQTELDTFSRLNSCSLLTEITYIWLKIKKTEINLKREIRRNEKYFNENFCNKNMEICKQKFYNIVFQNSKELKMVNVIKLYIFMFKSQGELEDNLHSWLQQY